MAKKQSKLKSSLVRVSDKIEKRIRVGESKTLKQKILRKPKAKGIQSVSATKTLRGFAHSPGPVVREVPQVEVVQDNRSQFFNSELETEKRGINKWMS